MSGKKKSESDKKTKDETLDVESFDKWYERNYAETINYGDVVTAADVAHSWIKEPLTGFRYAFSSIWRNQVLSLIRSTFPKKTEYATTVLRINRTVGKTIYHTNYAILYSYNDLTTKKFDHEYVVISGTFKSADGEFRRRFIPYQQIGHFIKKNDEIYKLFVEHIKTYGSDITFQSNTFFPDDKKYKHLDFDPIVLYFCTWVFVIDTVIKSTVPNHMADGFISAMIGSKDSKFYGSIPKEFISKMSVDDIADLQSAENLKKRIEIECGQKIIPLHVREIEQVGDIRHKTWRELYIGSLLSDLTINGISPSIPLLSNWFLIRANSKELYDNAISHTKLDHSAIASEIIKQLEQSRRGTYTIDDSHEIFLSVTMETLSESIEYPMKYAEKEVVMSDYSLVVLTEYAGKTFADYTTILYNKPVFQKSTGNMFGDHLVFSKYLFEYLYGFLSMNLLGVVHGDAHLNNITLHSLRLYYTENSDKPYIDNTFIVYNIGANNSIEGLYLFPHYGKYATIIDFSRGFLSEEHLMANFPEHKAAEYVSLQRRRMLKTWSAEVPEFVKNNLNQIESASFRNFDLVFKMFSAIDAYRVSTSMIALFASEGVRIPLESSVMLDKISDMAQKFLTIGMTDIFENRITKTDEIEHPNLMILQECFGHAHLSTYKPRKIGEINIVDYFSISNTIKYSATDPKRLPPNIKYDEIVKAGFPIVKYLVYNRHVAIDKYLKKTDPEKQVELVADGVKAKQAERRGRPTKSDQKKYIADLVASVKNADIETKNISSSAL
jgi:hypothetical protein